MVSDLEFTETAIHQAAVRIFLPENEADGACLRGPDPVYDEPTPVDAMPKFFSALFLGFLSFGSMSSQAQEASGPARTGPPSVHP